MGNHDACGSEIEDPADERRAKFADTDDDFHTRCGGSVEVRQQVGLGHAAVFEIEQQPIESHAGNCFGDDGGTDRNPGSRAQSSRIHN